MCGQSLIKAITPMFGQLWWLSPYLVPREAKTRSKIYFYYRKSIKFCIQFPNCGQQLPLKNISFYCSDYYIYCTYIDIYVSLVKSFYVMKIEIHGLQLQSLQYYWIVALRQNLWKCLCKILLVERLKPTTSHLTLSES